MKTNAVALRVVSRRCLGQVWDLVVQRAWLAPTALCSMEMWFGPASPSEVPPRLTLVSQASRREFLLHCALVVLGNADLKSSGSGSAVGEEIPALAPG